MVDNFLASIVHTFLADEQLPFRRTNSTVTAFGDFLKNADHSIRREIGRFFLAQTTPCNRNKTHAHAMFVYLREFSRTITLTLST